MYPKKSNFDPSTLKTSTVYFTANVKLVCSALMEYFANDMNEFEKEFIPSVEEYGDMKGYLTPKQARILGGISKHYFPNCSWWNNDVTNYIAEHLNENKPAQPNKFESHKDTIGRLREVAIESEKDVFTSEQKQNPSLTSHLPKNYS